MKGTSHLSKACTGAVVTWPIDKTKKQPSSSTPGQLQ